MSDSLRTLVRAYLQEAAVSPQAAASQGLALFMFKNDYPFLSFVLYDKDKMLADMEKHITNVLQRKAKLSMDTFGIGPETIYGYVMLAPEREDNQCNGAYEMMRSVATKGYGPLMYDVSMALTPNNTIMADRKSVSPQATGVWQKYANRGDVEQLPLDDYKDPKTPPKEDDCMTHKDPSRPFLDVAFHTNSPVNVDALFKANEEFFKQAQRILSKLPSAIRSSISEDTLNELIVFLADDVFITRYEAPNR